jgi:hypothetical protein
MIYWVVISNKTGEVVRRRPHGSLAMAEEYAKSVADEYQEQTIEIKALLAGKFPE